MPENRPGQTVGDTGATAGTGTSRPQQGSTAEATRAQAEHKARELEDAARRKAEEVKEEVARQADTGKSMAAERVHAVARALRSAGDALGQEGEDTAAGYGREAAERVEHMAGYLDRSDLGGLVGDLERTARQNPALFLGGAFLGGLVLGRFLGAGSPQRREVGGDQPSTRRTGTTVTRGMEERT